MPSSKRNRVVPTSKTKKNHKQLTRSLVANIHSALDQYSRVFVFSIENARSSFVKQVRVDWSDSRIFMGKTKVMAVALGRTAEAEYVPGIHQLSSYLSGEVGLLLTNRSEEEVIEFFDSFTESDFARSGATATYDFVIPHGELYTATGAGEEEPLPLSIESTLRQFGVPTRINKGKILLEDKPDGMPVAGMDVDGADGYVVCRQGDNLTSRQGNLLKIFGVKMAQFKMDIKAVFDKESESVKEIETT